MQVTASKVRVGFTRLLSQLSAGPVEITKHGKVVAVLVHPDLLATEKRDDRHCQLYRLMDGKLTRVKLGKEDGPVFPAESATG